MYTPMPTPPFDGTESCAGADARLFFSKNRNDLEAARELCAACPMFDACYEWAIIHEDYGLWAGTTRKDRFAIRKLRAAVVVAIPTPRTGDEPAVVDSAESMAA